MSDFMNNRSEDNSSRNKGIMLNNQPREEFRPKIYLSKNIFPVGKIFFHR